MSSPKSNPASTPDRQYEAGYFDPRATNIARLMEEGELAR
jgi:hypothetical protein